jgi:hypothetical protein
MTFATYSPEIIAEIKRQSGDGLSNRQIAKNLGINRNSLVKYTRNIEKSAGVAGMQEDYKVSIMQTSRSVNWWARYNVQHDDGSKLIMKTLPDKLMCFGDMQANYQHPDTIPFLCAVIARHKPDAFVMMGDEADLTGLKKHFMNADSLGPSQELERAAEFMQELFKIVPEAIALTSNHVADRISFAQGQGNIPNLMMRAWADIINAPKGWIWRDYIIWDKWLLEHGHKIAKGSRPNLLEGMAKRFNRHLSIMRGHFHSELGEHVKPVWMPGNWQARQCFTGCLMDYRKAGYTRDALMIGCVVLDKGVPHPIPMAVDESNRWVGRLIEG